MQISKQSTDYLKTGEVAKYLGLSIPRVQQLDAKLKPVRGKHNQRYYLVSVVSDFKANFEKNIREQTDLENKVAQLTKQRDELIQVNHEQLTRLTRMTTELDYAKAKIFRMQQLLQAEKP